MGKNIKINNSEPCLCGSGQKFKDCCKSKMFTSSTKYSEDILNNPKRVNAILQKMMDKTDFKICVYPDKSCCKLPIKNAHTLQNNGVLSAVSELEHVMVTDPLNKVREGYITRKISKNKATTFYGFCEYHDSYLFKDIELKEYKNEIKQNFLFAYRVLAQEYHKKERVISSLQNCVKENPSILISPIMVENYRMMDLARKDIRELLDIFNSSYMNQNFDINICAFLCANMNFDYANNLEGFPEILSPLKYYYNMEEYKKYIITFKVEYMNIEKSGFFRTRKILQKYY